MVGAISLFAPATIWKYAVYKTARIYNAFDGLEEAMNRMRFLLSVALVGVLRLQVGTRFAG